MDHGHPNHFVNGEYGEVQDGKRARGGVGSPFWTSCEGERSM